MEDVAAGRRGRLPAMKEEDREKVGIIERGRRAMVGMGKVFDMVFDMGIISYLTYYVRSYYKK